MAKHIIEVKNLVKQFGSFTAVNNISFNVEEGEVLGFLGPNGAGKTTTIQMLLGLLEPSSGTISYAGKNLMTHREEILEQVNFSSTYTNLPWYLTVKENLSYLSYLYNIKDRKKRIAELVEVFKLDSLLDKGIGELSAGQMTRVNMAKAFLNSPKVLLLDEPTASLDPDVAGYIREFIESERKKFNISILFTSHNMAEVEELCERVIFISNGKILANDRPENLAKTIELAHVELMVKDKLAALKAYCDKARLTYRMGSNNHIVIDVKEHEIAHFLQKITQAKISYNEISIEKPSLEDYFLEMSKKKI